jgi:hypothetical protein
MFWLRSGCIIVHFILYHEQANKQTIAEVLNDINTRGATAKNKANFDF